MGIKYQKTYKKRKKIQKFNPNREYLINAVKDFEKKGGKIKKIKSGMDSN